MKTAIRSILALGLLLGFSLAAAAADSKDVESTPQAKVYRASLKAIADGDYNAYAKCMTSQAVKEIEAQTKELGKTTKEGMELMKAMAPSDIKFTGLEVDGKKATLSATGKQDEEVMYGSHRPRRRERPVEGWQTELVEQEVVERARQRSWGGSRPRSALSGRARGLDRKSTALS